MKKLLLITIIALSTSYMKAQITFQKTFGGTNSEIAQSVQQTSDGGYIIAGKTEFYAASLSDVYLIKTTANGDTSWTKTFGGINEDGSSFVQQTFDGGYIIAGYTRSFGAGGADVLLIKTTANGDILWTKTFGGINDEGSSFVQQTSDSGFIIAGGTTSFGAGSSDVLLIKTTINGDTLWTKTYGGTNVDDGCAVKQTADGGFIIAGITRSFGAGQEDVYLIKTTNNGDTLWTKTFGGTGYDLGYSVQQTIDGGYIIAGTNSSFIADDYDVYLIKTNVNGNALWTKTFGGAGDFMAYSVQQTTDSGYIITGQATGPGLYDVYIIKTTDNGDTLWTKTYGGTGKDQGTYVRQTIDGGYIIAGYTESFATGMSDVYFIKTDTNGNSSCNKGNTVTITGNPATQQSSPATVITTPAIMVSNPLTTIGFGGIVTSLCTTVGISELSSNSESINIYPVPTINNLSIETPQKATIEIINIQGQIIKTLTTTEDKTQVDVSALAGGVYIIKLNTGEGSVVRKFVKQ